jgi:hypothetical protein
MKAKICFTIAVLLAFACAGGESDETSPADESTGPEMDTLVITDSIGVLMGDSRYMFGSILKAEALPDGGTILLDRSTGLISIFDENGDFELSFGGLGEAPGEFNYPGLMTVLGDGRIAVIDWMDREICFFSNDGEYIGCASCQDAGRPLSMTAAGDSCFVIYSTPTRQIENTFRMGFEVTIREGMSEEPVATPFSHLFDFGLEEYDFRPGYLAVASGNDGRIYLHRMDSEDYIVEVMNPDGQQVDTIYGESIQVSWDDAERYCSIPQVTFAVQIDGESQRKTGELTEFVPQVEHLGIDSLGNLWAQRGPSREFMWDVFSPEGEIIRQVILTEFPDTAFINVEVNEHGIVAWDLVPEDYPRLYRLGFK